MAKTRAGTETLHDALAQLNEASRERRADVTKLIDEKYTDLREAFGDAANATGNWFKVQGRDAANRAKVTATAVDKHLRSHPWHYVGGAAAAGFLTGLVIGRRK